MHKRKMFVLHHARRKDQGLSPCKNGNGRNYSAISLFSGSLGLDLGLERAGFETKIFVENNK